MQPSTLLKSLFIAAGITGSNALASPTVQVTASTLSTVYFSGVSTSEYASNSASSVPETIEGLFEDFYEKEEDLPISFTVVFDETSNDTRPIAFIPLYTNETDNESTGTLSKREAYYNYQIIWERVASFMKYRGHLSF